MYYRAHERVRGLIILINFTTCGSAGMIVMIHIVSSREHERILCRTVR